MKKRKKKKGKREIEENPHVEHTS